MAEGIISELEDRLGGKQKSKTKQNRKGNKTKERKRENSDREAKNKGSNDQIRVPEGKKLYLRR